MLNKLGTVELLKAIKTVMAENIDGTIYDTEPPRNAPAPFYLLTYVGSVEDNTKMTFRDLHTVYIDCIAKENAPHAAIYKMIDAAREALTQEIDLPAGFTLARQTCTGTVNLQQDETKEWHAVVGFEFLIAYGFKCKN